MDIAEVDIAGVENAGVDNDGVLFCDLPTRTSMYELNAIITLFN